MTSAPMIFYGAVINPQNLTSYAALPNCLLSVGASGTIDWIVENVAAHALQATLAQKGCVDVNVIELRAGEFLLPGLIDTHTHAPQFPNLGAGQQYELLDWLDIVTFPMEAKFEDLEFAKRTYKSVVRRVIDCGTTTCCYYGSLHLDATKALADIVHADGQRAFIGKCNMNRNSPNYVERSVKASIAETNDLITYIRSLPSPSSGTSYSSQVPLVQPILTPRLALFCTPELLTELGTLASSDPSLHIQTHISENKAEVELTGKLFPEAPNYAGVYDSFGLVRHNTILSHAVHLDDAEVETIAKRRAGISHCPNSNFNLRSGVAPIGRYLDRGIKVGLGTDVSGGFSYSMLNAVQNASIASKVVAFSAEPPAQHGSATTQFTNRQLSVATLLYLATLGGAEVCDLDKVVGSFAPGKSFDALLVNTHVEKSPIFSSPDTILAGTEKEALDASLERFLFCGDDRNISRVYVQGRFIGGTSYHK